MSTSTKHLESLKRIAEILNQSADLKQALHDSLEIIVSILDLKVAWVFLQRSGEEGYYLAAQEGLPLAMTPGSDPWKGGCQCNTMARTGKLTQSLNMVKCSRIERASLDVGFTVHASVPLKTPRESIGILNVVSKSDEHFDSEELEMLGTVGSLMGTAIERAEMYDRVRHSRAREQKALLELSNAMLGNLELNEAMGRVVRISRRAFGADLCIMGLHNGVMEDQECFQNAAVDGIDLGIDQQKLCSMLHGPAGAAFAKLNKPVHVLLNEDGLPEAVNIFTESHEADKIEACMGRDTQLWDFFGRKKIRSLYTAPIKATECRSVIGQMYLLHHSKPRLTSLEHLTALLANQAALAVEQARLNLVRQEQEALQSELRVAQNIQRAFLKQPPNPPEGWDIACSYDAAKEVGGDFYDFIPLPDQSLGLVIADVAGKGIPASLVMVMARTLMRAVAREVSNPLEAVNRVNQLLLEEGTSERFLTLFYAHWQPSENRLRYVRAGHNPPLLYRAATNDLEQLFPDGIVLAVTDDPFLTQDERMMDPGDILALYTDGVSEAMNSQREEYGEDRLGEIIRRNAHASAEAILEAVKQDVTRFVDGAPQHDDITLVLLKRNA